MFVVAALVVGVVSGARSVADEVPISGTVQAIDASARTLTLQTTVQGKTRDVNIVLKPETKIVKFAGPTEPGKTGFVEQPLALSDLKTCSRMKAPRAAPSLEVNVASPVNAVNKPRLSSLKDARRVSL